MRRSMLHDYKNIMICECILSGDVGYPMLLVTEMSLYLMVALGYKQSMLTYGAKVLWFSIMYFSAIVEFHVMFDQPFPDINRPPFSPFDSHIACSSNLSTPISIPHSFLHLHSFILLYIPTNFSLNSQNRFALPFVSLSNASLLTSLTLNCFPYASSPYFPDPGSL